jgi:CHRD domain-containing protein/PEP-CTERM motif-containing protein
MGTLQLVDSVRASLRRICLILGIPKQFWRILQGECSMRYTCLAKFMVVAFAGLFVANRASAQTYQLDANLDPFQEVPPHNTPGYGSADFTLDAGAATLTINLNTGLYADLLAGASTVRLQDAAVGANGPTLGLFNLDTPGNTSGTFSGSVGGLTAGQIADVLAGNTYVNITDSVFPSGEIRGQIFTVPEPGSLAIFGGVGLLAMRRRRATA